MRRAELIMAVVMLFFSVYLIKKSMEVPYGWVQGVGPGPGFFPIMLAIGMALSCVWILVNYFRRATAVSQSEEPFFEPVVFKSLMYIMVSLFLMVGSIHIIGVYFAMPVFFIWYMRYLGDHSWAGTFALAFIMPVVTFLFFEILLNITLPKGYTDPLFYPIYDIFM